MTNHSHERVRIRVSMISVKEVYPRQVCFHSRKSDYLFAGLNILKELLRKEVKSWQKQH
ncbi:MAG: hypothetical protein BWX80_04173 [Candidatus Hydrogenedentes bacterium ADurb.Bin101]|nr:MAG: hypothetical protein BWX80_04173 [Candidatus Hydrogenedentes bacterium ADurb.Bin101]